MFHCPKKKPPGFSIRIHPPTIHSVDADAFLFKAAKLPGPPSPTGGPPTAGAAGAAGTKGGGWNGG